MVLKWDSQIALKPIAFDQDDHVRSEDEFLDIAVVSRGGRLNSCWKKVRHHIAHPVLIEMVCHLRLLLL